MKTCVLLVVLGVGASTAAAGEWSVDFRGQPPDPQLVKLLGANPLKVIQTDSRGLRITQPARPAGTEPVGISPRFRVQGDFEITTAFQILQATKPTAGHGIGVSIWISRKTATRDAAWIGCYLTPQGNVLAATHASTGPDGKRRFGGAKPVPTEGLAGSLRLKRTGSTLQFLAATDTSGTFREISELAWGPEDLNTIRVAAEAADSPGVLDVLIKDLHIQTSPPVVVAAGSGPRPVLLAVLWAGLGFVLAALCGGVGLLLWRRRFGARPAGHESGAA